MLCVVTIYKDTRNNKLILFKVPLRTNTMYSHNMKAAMLIRTAESLHHLSCHDDNMSAAMLRFRVRVKTLEPLLPPWCYHRPWQLKWYNNSAVFMRLAAAILQLYMVSVGEATLNKIVEIWLHIYLHKWLSQMAFKHIFLVSAC